MTRRNFLNAELAAVAATRLPGAGAPGAAPGSAPLPRARWMDNGLIAAGGSHEPYTFVVRRGGQRHDAYEQYQAAQSEELIRRLSSLGVEVFHTHMYKGAGMAHERAEMEDAKRVIGIAHRYGMKVDSYIQWNTMIYEPFFVEEPRAQKWVQRDILGQPILLTYGYQQSFRYRPCFANQEYLDYLKKIVRFAVEDARTDFIHFDNFDLNAEPDSCHCEWCVRGFRDFLRKKYSPAKRKERFGFEDVSYINPPQWNLEHPPQRMEIIFDPAIQEWIDYRCQTMSDALGQMARLAKSINPEVAIEVNPHGITGGNRAWQAGLDHSRFLKWTEAYVTEEQNNAAWLPDGRLISKIRSYKLARTYRNVLKTPLPDDAIAMAEDLAFNQTLGMLGPAPLAVVKLEYLAFYRKNRDLFVDAADAGNVAVLRSYPSITYHNARAQLSAILVEQALIQSRIPFDLIFDEHVADLSKYRVLVLPDSECLSDGQLTEIRRFVANGGGLVATGLSGLYDEWRRLRVRPGFDGLLESQRPAKAYQEKVEGTEEAGAPARKEAGRGRVVYIPAVRFDGPQPQPENYFSIGNKFWKRPGNWSEIVDAVRWAAREELPVETAGPEYLVSNFTSQPKQRRVLLHLVNYNAHRGGPVRDVNVACRLTGATSGKEVRLYSPDLDAPLTLHATNSGSHLRFTIPEIKFYAIAVVS